MTAPAEASSDDPRAQRSRQRLRDALRALLRQEDLGEIGVSELCREAGVHRTTFYGHYTSVGSLAAEVYASMIDETVPDEPLEDQDLPAIARLLFDSTVALLERVADERPALQALLASSASLDFRQQVRARYRAHVARAIDVLERGGLDIGGDPDIAGAFIAGGLLSAVEVWATRDDDDAVAFAREMLRAMPRWWPPVEV